MPAFEDEHGTYIMNAKDLRAVQHVERLTQMGVHSLKIEGRTKSHFYCARTTQVYRRAIDDAVAGRDFDRSLMTDLESLAQRGYTEGFLRRHVHDEYQNYQNGSSVSEQQQFVGELTGERRERLAEVKVKNRFGLGDHMELMTPKGNFHFDLHQLHNIRGEAIEVAPGDGHTVYLPIPDAVDLSFGLLMRMCARADQSAFTATSSLKQIPRATLPRTPLAPGAPRRFHASRTSSRSPSARETRNPRTPRPWRIDRTRLWAPAPRRPRR
jgi:putative protease